MPRPASRKIICACCACSASMPGTARAIMDAEACAPPPRRRTSSRPCRRERIAKELLRLLEAGNPAPVLRVMAATGILSELLPGALQLAAAGTAGRDRCRQSVSARWPAAAGGAAARQRRGGPCRGRCAETVQCRSRAAGAGAERRRDFPAHLSAREARRLLYRIGPWRAFATRCCCIGPRRPKAPACPGACCWKWRKAGSGRAFRSPAAT